MKKIEFADVENYFQSIWVNSNEFLWYEIAWNVLADAGLTCFNENDLKRHCEILVYPYVLQMLMGEFSYFMFDNSISYYEYVKKFYESMGDDETIFENFAQECSVMHWIFAHSCALDD